MQFSTSALILAFSALATAFTGTSVGTAPVASGTGFPGPSGNGSSVVTPTLTAPTGPVFTGAASGRWEAGVGAVVLAIAGAVVAL